jgi:hypothetical protein
MLMLLLSKIDTACKTVLLPNDVFAIKIGPPNNRLSDEERSVGHPEVRTDTAS